MTEPLLTPLERLNIGTEFNLMKIIEGEVTRKRHPSARRNTTFYPSGASAILPDGSIIGGGCHFQDALRLCDVEPSDGDEFYMHMIWDLGKSVENKVVDAMKCAGIYESNAVKFLDIKRNISGELDVVGRYRYNKEVRYYVVEQKSVYGQGVTHVITGRRRPFQGQPAFNPKPKESNLMQTMIYLDQFAYDGPDRYALDFSVLNYIPRDKPNGGRSYVIVLMDKTNLPIELKSYSDEMKDGHKYAVIATNGFPTYVETRFSIQDIYERFEILLKKLKRGEVPARDFQRFFTEEEIDKLVKEGEISKTSYNEWVKEGKPAHELGVTPGHYLCQSYCPYRKMCWKANGEPNKETDKVVQELINIRFKEVANG